LAWAIDLGFQITDVGRSLYIVSFRPYHEMFFFVYYASYSINNIQKEKLYAIM
jgi:hypothetical protein